MAKIHILDNHTIDKIAAGEVVERPMSVVKELVENAIDAGATIITVEIKNGGLKLIRVTDNGTGIETDQIRNAFASHATSKISDASDLNALYTLGFRGEALSSIAAVARVEVTSRIDSALTGVHYCIEGGKEIKCEEVGAPVGTTFLIRDLFYNTLPRLKFLKSESTEGSYITDLMEHLALSMPGISFNYILNGQTKFSTSGRNDLKEVIYRLYGRDMAYNLREINLFDESISMRVEGYLGLPVINRSNRAGEIFFINHRFVKSRIISKAVEEGYIEYLMQHKFPFCVLNIDFDPKQIDVNVHPTKQEIRLTQEKLVYNSIVDMISSTLSKREMIDSIILADEKVEKKSSFSEKSLSEESVSEESVSEESVSEESVSVIKANDIHHSNSENAVNAFSRDDNTTAPIIIPQQFEQTRIKNNIEIKDTDNNNGQKQATDFGIDAAAKKSEEIDITGKSEKEDDDFFTDETNISTKIASQIDSQVAPAIVDTKKEQEIKEFQQLDFKTDEQILSVKARREYRIIGQVFKTYWLIEYRNELMIMDQHAAHEKVNFERLMSAFKNKTEIPSQTISPPAIMNLSNQDLSLLNDNIERFEELGFVIDEFGEHDIAIRSVPMDLYRSTPQDIISEVLGELSNLHKSSTPDIIRSRIATYACKAAIKGNNLISQAEVEALLDEMLTLDNPYNCPHGRPTLIRISQAELEKKFHRIV